MTRPVVALDVDGVLAADPDWISAGAPALHALGYRPHGYDGPGPDGLAAHATVWLNAEHEVWLREVTERGVELVWASSWGHLAAEWIALQLRLPTMPVIQVPHHGPGFGWSAKLAAIRQWVGDRPLAWIDDQLGGKEPAWAQDRSDAGIPTLIIQTDPGRGLERHHIDELLTWLHPQITTTAHTIQP